jgi:acetyl esterase/lipase
MKKWVFASVSLALLASAGTAQERQRLGAECRKEVRALCFSSGVRPDRDAMRACLKDKASQLSEACRGELRKRMEQRRERQPAQPKSEGGKEISYGSDASQKLDFWPATASGKAPALVVYVHGGGWSRGDKVSGAGSKPEFYNGLGMAFASLNYRLVPAVQPGDQARDIATAISALRRDAGRLGFDPNRIILMGHSAGAHLAALVATDTRYLATVGVPLSAVRGSVLLDGVGYDVAKQMAYEGNRVAVMYQAAFGSDPERQKALSPATHVAAPNIANWLILHVASRADSKAQSEALGAGLKGSGARVAVKAVPGSTHMSVKRDAGVPGSFVATEISAFVKSL